MNVIERTDPASLRVLSVEDQFETIKGPLDSLAFDGYDVQWSPKVDVAEDWLRQTRFNLLILDQRVERPNGMIDFTAGSTLAMKLKRGDLGDINIDIPFVFVTGSDDWVKESEMMKLPGYRGILVKASDVTTKLRAFCAQALRKVEPTAYRDRVLVRVERIDDGGLYVVIPSWSLTEMIHVPEGALPSDADLTELGGARVFARMDLSVHHADEVKLERWEIPEQGDDA